MISVRAISAASSRVVSPWAETDATTTGAALKLNEPTVGSHRLGSVALRRFSSIVAVASSRSCRSRTGRGRTRTSSRRWTAAGQPGNAEMARSIGFATCSVTSAAPAPGYGAMTVTIGNETSGQQLLLEAAPGEDAGDEEGDGEQERDAPLRDGELGQAGHGCSWSVGRTGCVDGEGVGEDPDRQRRRLARSSSSMRSNSARSWRVLSSRICSSVSRPNGVTETLDLAAVGRVVDAVQQAERHEVVDGAARGRDRDAEPLGDLRHR